MGEKVFSTYYYKNDSPENAVLTPGEHTITVKYEVGTKYLYAKLQFTGTEGQKLIIKKEHRDLGKVAVWMEDKNTNQKIGKPLQ